MHRVGGLEKHALLGTVSYDPLNHEEMVRVRAEKVARVAREIGPLRVEGPDEGALAVVGWGSTHGAIVQAVRDVRRAGARVSAIHLRWLNPLGAELGPLLRRFKKVLVVEGNLGQLTTLLRVAYLVDARCFHKVQGKPFKVVEVRAAIEGALAVKKED